MTNVYNVYQFSNSFVRPVNHTYTQRDISFWEREERNDLLLEIPLFKEKDWIHDGVLSVSVSHPVEVKDRWTKFYRFIYDTNKLNKEQINSHVAMVSDELINLGFTVR